MSLTLSFGYKKPQDGDPGSSWFDDLEFDIQQLNDHTHNGTNSSKITGASVTSVTQAILAANWVHVANGIYRQLITMPGSMLYDEYLVIFKQTSSPNSPMFLNTEKVSSNTFYVYCNDNSVNCTAYYLN